MNGTHGHERLAGNFRLLLAALCALAFMPQAQAQDAASLRARYEVLRETLADNQFGRPLSLESSEKGGILTGDIYALVEQPFAATGPALQGMGRWCDILMLQFNVKDCHASLIDARHTLSLNIGPTTERSLADTFLFKFLYVETDRPNYMSVVMTAAEGPLSTSRYHIVLELSELDAQRSFLHLSYSYTQGFAARIATQIYLATVGHSRTGFSIVGRRAGGEPVYVASTRGVVERNAMRCYLAVEAYLDALSTPVPQQLEKRLNHWYAEIERYPEQLHEVALDDYLTMKHFEIQRQQAPVPLTAAR